MEELNSGEMQEMANEMNRQAQQVFGQGNADETALAVGAGMLVIGFIVLVVMLVVRIFYLLTLYRAMKKCAPQNQAMAPGLVWLELVPLLNIAWIFMNVINVSKSLGAEFKTRGIPKDDNPGMIVGLVSCICSVTSWLPFLGAVLGIAGFITWIMYWVKISGFSSELEGTSEVQTTTQAV